MVSVVPPVRHPNRLVLPIATDMAAHPAPPALGALAVPGAVRLVVALLGLCQEAVRDFLP
jgi:hypothetical protein